ncbi:MAG: SMI1/KNR4 family protein [Planctomycetota bacterium]
MDDVTAQLDDLLADSFSSGPASEASIAAAEQKLGLLFTPSYRLFLSRFGASLSTGFELYGLPQQTDPNQPPQWTDAVNATLRLRPDSLPADSVHISHDGMDHGFFLQCSQTDPLFDGRVIEWGPSHDGGEVIASNFVAFLAMQMGR